MIGEVLLIAFAMIGLVPLTHYSFKVADKIIDYFQDDEIKLLSRTLEEKREELCRRKQIEKLSFEIECMDGLLYPEEKEERREPLNDESEHRNYWLTCPICKNDYLTFVGSPQKCTQCELEKARKYTVNPLRFMGVTTEEAAENHNRATRNLRRGTDRKPVKAPVPPTSKRGGTYEHSGPTKEEEEFYFGGNADE